MQRVFFKIFPQALVYEKHWHVIIVKLTYSLQVFRSVVVDLSNYYRFAMIIVQEIVQ